MNVLHASVSGTREVVDRRRGCDARIYSLGAHSRSAFLLAGSLSRSATTAQADAVTAASCTPSNLPLPAPSPPLSVLLFNK